MHADYVIVGAGSAGCALAARLSEDPDTSRPAARGGRLGPPPEHRDPGGVRQAVQDAAGLGLRDRARAPLRRPLDLRAPRQGPRRLELDERDALRPRAAARLRPLGGAGRDRAGAGTTCARTSSRREQRARRLRAPRRRRPAERRRRALAAAADRALPRRRRGGGHPAHRRLQRPRAGRRLAVQVTQRNGRRFSAADAYLRPARGARQPRGRHGRAGARASRSPAGARPACASATARGGSASRAPGARSSSAPARSARRSC